MTIQGIRITQAELAEMFELQNDVAEKTKRLEELKSNIKPLLIAKVPIEHGRFDAVLIVRPCRHVPWRELFVKELGVETADRYKKLYPPQIFSEVHVLEHAIPPLWKGKEDSFLAGE